MLNHQIKLNKHTSSQLPFLFHISKDLATATTGKAASDDEGQRKRSFKTGTVSLLEIRKYQKTTELLLNKKPVNRLVREIAHSITSDLRFQPNDIKALQEAVEGFSVERFDLCRARNSLEEVHGFRGGHYEIRRKYVLLRGIRRFQ